MSMKRVKPLWNRLLVKRSQQPIAKGKILLPDAAQEKPKQGKVIAVGTGSLDKDGNVMPMNVKIGETVLFSAYAGTEVNLDGHEGEFLVLSEDDILAILV